MIDKVINGILVAFILLMFLFGFIPQMETSASTANISNSVVASMGDMAVWIIPLLAIVSVILVAVKWVRTRSEGF